MHSSGLFAVTGHSEVNIYSSIFPNREGHRMTLLFHNAYAHLFAKYVQRFSANPSFVSAGNSTRYFHLISISFSSHTLFSHALPSNTPVHQQSNNTLLRFGHGYYQEILALFFPIRNCHLKASRVFVYNNILCATNDLVHGCSPPPPSYIIMSFFFPRAYRGRTMLRTFPRRLDYVINTRHTTDDGRSIM